jgi:serine/threonine protein kinase
MTEPTEDPIDAIAEAFLERFRRGERPPIEEFTQANPQFADRIRDLFPALVDLEVLGSGLGPVRRSVAPTRLGEYRIVREIGRGGMGVVYEAYQESLGRHVAVKVLDPDAVATAQRVERFRRESRIAARLHHEHIVPVYGVGADAGRLYFAMQHIAGQGLDAVLRELRSHRAGSSTTDLSKPASGWFTSIPAEYYRNVARIGAAIADALAHAHSQGVLHRDIKPSNLMLDARGHIWVTDFGLARAEEADDLTNPGDVLGTPRYMAPERFRGPADSRSDVYSLGATLYELITLEPVFAETDRPRLMEAVRVGQIVPPRERAPQVPRDLDTIVMKSLAPDPAGRYPSAEAMAADLKRFVAGEPVTARPPGVLERVSRWARRNPASAALLFLSFASLTVIAGVIGWYSVQLRDALADSNRNLDAARAENRRADENLADLQQAVDQFATIALENPALRKADLNVARSQLLDSAVGYYEKVLAQVGDRPAVRLGQAKVATRLSTVLHELGRAQEAAVIGQRAVQLYDGLVASNPDNASYKAGLAYALLQECCAHNTLRNYAECIDAGRRSVEIYRSISPENPQYRISRCWVLCVLAESLLDTGGPGVPALADEACELSLALWKERPSVNNRLALVKALRTRAASLRNEGKLKEAERDYRQGESLRDQEAESSSQQLVREQAELSLSYGYLLSHFGKHREAQEQFQYAADRMGQLFETYRSNGPAALNAVRARSSLGWLHVQHGRYDEAHAELSRSVDMLLETGMNRGSGQPFRVVWFVFQNRGLAASGLARFTEAAADFRRAADAALTPDQRWQSLIRHCQCLSRAGHLPAAEEAYRSMIDGLADRVAWYPDYPELAGEMVPPLFQLAELLLDRGLSEEVNEMFDLCRRIRLAIVKSYPKHIEVARNMVLVDADRGLAWERADVPELARQSFERAGETLTSYRTAFGEDEFFKRWTTVLADRGLWPPQPVTTGQ